MFHELIAKLMLVPVAMFILSFAISVDEENSAETKPGPGTDLIVSDLLNDTSKR